MKNAILLSLVLSLFLFNSCSKSKDNDDLNTGQQIQGKWLLKKWTSIDFSGGRTQESTDNYDPGDYIQFNSGGQLTVRVDGEVSKGTWQLRDGEKRLWVMTPQLDAPDEGYEIKTLNNNSMVLYFKEGTATNYSDISIFLER